MKEEDIIKDEYAVLRADNYSGSYEGGGLVLCIRDGFAAIASVSHCSCYGTWDGGIGATAWIGTVDALKEMAKSKQDWSMEGRTVDPADSDYLDIKDIYEYVAKNL